MAFGPCEGRSIVGKGFRWSPLRGALYCAVRSLGIRQVGRNAYLRPILDWGTTAGGLLRVRVSAMARVYETLSDSRPYRVLHVGPVGWCLARKDTSQVSRYRSAVFLRFNKG